MIVLEKLEDLKKYYNAEENSYKFQESIQIKFDLKIESDLIVKGDINANDIVARDIDARDINARDITAGNIDAYDINAGKIDACDINANDIVALNISTWDITAWSINANDIVALNIAALNIDALNIKYYAYVVAYRSFKCISATAMRKNGIALCLDQPIYYKDKENK